MMKKFMMFLLSGVLAMGISAPPQASGDDGFEIVGHKGQPMLSAIMTQSAQDDAYRRKALVWMEETMRIGGGKSAVPGADFTREQLGETYEDLRNNKTGSSRFTRRQSTPPTATPTAGSASLLGRGDYDEPNSWPVVGDPQDDRSYWRSSWDLGLYRGVCNIWGCERNR